MRVLKTDIPGLLIIETVKHGDIRGWFVEHYNKERYVASGITNDFVQDNHSYSAKKGTLRGIHFQNDPYSQAKLVYCIRGKVLDIAVDLRKGSPTYLKHHAIELSEENSLQFLVPRGFGHGFITLTDDAEFVYKVDNPYAPDFDRSIRYDDPDIAIDWGKYLNGMDPILAEKDINAPFLKDSDINFTY